MPISLWLVEDDPLYQAPFARLVETTEQFALGRTFDEYEALVACLSVGGDGPDLVVMDLHLPRLDGPEATRDLRQRLPDVPIVVLTISDDPASVAEALGAGASGYIVKGTPPELMFRALREAHSGGTYFAPSVARHVLGHFSAPAPLEEPLTEREQEVLRELAGGLSKARIADALYLSPHTVDTHVRSVYRKLHAKNAAEAAAKAVRIGLA